MLPCNHECNDGSDWLLGASDIEKQQQTGPDIIAIDLQLYKIFKIMRVSFFWDAV